MNIRLYLDETGTADHNLRSPFFVMSGVLMQDDHRVNLKIHADQVKFKYWGRTNIVFHSREIGRRENDFSILKDPAVEQSFYKDLQRLVTDNGAKCLFVSVDKSKAQTMGWSSADIYSKASEAILELFIRYLAHKKYHGTIVIESAGTQKDIEFYKRYIHFLAGGFPSLGVSHHQMKKILTSISFVSKNNFDIETQLADLLAYPAGFKCLVTSGIKQLVPNSYEDRMIKTLSQKLVTTPGVSGFLQIP